MSPISAPCRAWRTTSTSSPMKLTSTISPLLKRGSWNWQGGLTRLSSVWVTRPTICTYFAKYLHILGHLSAHSFLYQLKDEPGTFFEDIQVELSNCIQAINNLSGKIDTLAKPTPSPWFLPTGWPNLTASRLHRMALLRWGRTLSGDRWALAKENGTIKQQKIKVIMSEQQNNSPIQAAVNALNGLCAFSRSEWIFHPFLCCLFSCLAGHRFGRSLDNSP